MKNINAFDVGILGNMDATEIAGLIKDGEITSKEAVACSVERALKLEPTLNAIVTDCFDTAMSEAEKEREGVFSGVPTFIKDLINVKGMPTLHGSKGVGKKIHKKNEKITEQILSTGCLVLGKSTTSEFGLLPSAETLLQGSTLNPLNPEYSTGGSSGGAAALVSSGVVPFAHAADGGGSIRIPASCCGLIGLKPSRGRDIESPTGMLPIDIVCQGILSRTVRDTANYFSAIEKYHKATNLPPIGLVNKSSKKRLLIAMFTDTASGIESQSNVKDSVISAGKFCESLGHRVEHISSPFDQEVKIDFLTYWSFLTYMLRRFGKFSYGLNFQKTKLEIFTTQMARVYPKVMFNTPGIVKRLKKFSIYYESLFDKYDLLLNPVLSHPVPKIGYFSPENNFFSTIEKLSQYVNFTTIQNISGAPSIALPMGKCDNKLPIGVQFSAEIGQEQKLLELAFEIEENKGFVDWFGTIV